MFYLFIYYNLSKFLIYLFFFFENTRKKNSEHFEEKKSWNICRNIPDHKILNLSLRNNIFLSWKLFFMRIFFFVWKKILNNLWEKDSCEFMRKNPVIYGKKIPEILWEKFLKLLFIFWGNKMLNKKTISSFPLENAFFGGKKDTSEDFSPRFSGKFFQKILRKVFPGENKFPYLFGALSSML